MALPAKKLITPEEYLEQESLSEEKHEYFDGEIFMMSGGTISHNTIAVNLVRETSLNLKKKPCRVFNSDMRLNVAENGLFTYPDAYIVCGEPQFYEDRDDTLTNAVVIFEVLSPSTHQYDRTGKFELYRAMPTFKEYVLIDSERIYIEHYILQPDGSWTMMVYDKLEDEIKLKAVDCAIPLSEMYLDVKFDAKKVKIKR